MSLCGASKNSVFRIMSDFAVLDPFGVLWRHRRKYPVKCSDNVFEGDPDEYDQVLSHSCLIL